MTDVVGANDAPRPKPAARDWWSEISDALTWLHRRWFPFSAIWLGIAAILLVDFSLTRHVPLQLDTSGMVGTLPMMAALSAAAILGMSIGLVAPIILLPAPRNHHGRSLTELCARDTSITKNLIRYFAPSWIGGSVLMAVLVSAFVFAAAQWNHQWWDALAVFASPVITAILWRSLFLRRRQRRKSDPDQSSDRSATRSASVSFHSGKQRSTSQTLGAWRHAIACQFRASRDKSCARAKRLWAGAGALCMTAVAFFVQALVLTAVVLVTVAATSAAYSTNQDFRLASIVLVVGIPIVIVITQSSIPLVILRKVTSWQHPLRRLIVCFTGLAIACAAIPPIGGALAAVPLSVTASGGRGCVVLVAKPYAPFRLPDPTHGDPVVERAIDVHVVAVVGGSYYVTRANNRDLNRQATVYTIDRASVAGVTTCSK